MVSYCVFIENTEIHHSHILKDHRHYESATGHHQA